MTAISNTPKPPYFAVIFTSLKTPDDEGYAEAASKMVELAALQDGFLGIETAREQLGITVSYWRDLESIKSWKKDAEHRVVQKLGRGQWYANFKVRIARVERDYGL